MRAFKGFDPDRGTPPPCTCRFSGREAVPLTTALDSAYCRRGISESRGFDDDPMESGVKPSHC